MYPRTALHVLPVLTRGGAELQLCQLAAAQVRSGTAVTIACLTVSDELRARLGDAGVSLVVARSRPVRFPIEILRSARAAEVVHAWMYHGFVLALLLRPWSRAVHVWSVRRADPASPGLSRRTRWVIRRTRRWSRRCVDGIIYCSDAARRAHEQFGYVPRASTVIHNAVTVDRQPQRRTGRAVQFGFLGRWHRDKGVDVLLAAWRHALPELSPATLVLAGPGLSDDNVQLLDLTRGLSKSVSLRGPISDPEDYLLSLDCLVSPSRTEGFPNVVAEAMALGVPIVATEVGGTAEVIGDAGTLVPPENPSAIARALVEYQSDPTELRERARSGLARAAEFSVERTAERTAEFYAQLTR